MSRTALILGASGRFGRTMAEALVLQGWEIRRFDRARDDLMTASEGAALIVNGWNPPYDKWADTVPELTQRVITAAQTSGARVVFPGNVYVYGAEAPDLLTIDTPHAADNPLGRLRIEIEAMYRAAGVALLILRAGDFIDTEMSGNWYDKVITRKLKSGKIVYPGPSDIPHAWAFLPDLARAGAELVTQDLPRQLEVLFPGYTLTGADLAAHLSEASGRPITATPMGWGAIRVGALFNPMLRGLLEMRYLWSMPHGIDPTALDTYLPHFAPTDIVTALARTAPVQALKDAG